MSTGKHEIPSAKRESKRVSHRAAPARHSASHAKQGSKRSIALIAALVLVITGVVGGTVAYLMTKTEPVVNVFEPTEVKCEVQSDNSVKNTGKVDAYIRATAVANFVTADGHLCADCGSALVILGGTSWTQGADGYYYYNGKVPKDGSTAPLNISQASPTGNHSCQLKIEVFASAIQADPSNVVTDVWGYTPGN